MPLGGVLAGDVKGFCYTCTTCGEQWARMELSSRGYYINTSLPCPDHGNAFSRGGSILKPLVWWDIPSGGTLEKTLDTLDRAVLVHEIEMIFKQKGL